MLNLQLRLNLEVPSGMEIFGAIQEAKKISKKIGCLVFFRFNDQEVYVNSNSDIDVLINNYLRDINK